MVRRTLIVSACGLAAAVIAAAGATEPGEIFRTADACTDCHDGLSTPAGDDYSFGAVWRSSMMANAARDPYWHAAVRREVTDHPADATAIEDECSTCHMPMAHVAMSASGGKTPVFANVAALSTPAGGHAADGVSCTVCHQIRADNLGRPESFTGAFTIDGAEAGTRRAFGPYRVMHGPARMMWFASGFVPYAATHIQSSEVCGTCHTVYRHPTGPAGERLGQLPEQTPYLEWLHSRYRSERSCQSCHMEEVAGIVPISNMMGHRHAEVSRHDFRGGNVFMLRLLAAHRDALAVNATPRALEEAQAGTVAQLQAHTAMVEIVEARADRDRVAILVAVANLAGHKLPTAYPSRRAWLHVTVRAADGSVAFESGKPLSKGNIEGNDNDADAARFEPHYQQIERADQVQIYESVIGDRRDAPTTGLVSAVKYLKDNRLLPEGFDKSTAPADVAVRGRAAADRDFGAGGDCVRYAARVGRSRGPYRVEAELRYQTIGYRWAENLRGYDQAEAKRFVAMYDAAAPDASVVLARDERAAESAPFTPSEHACR